MIDIYVQRTRAKACADAPITSGSVGLVARFRFSEEWEELNKIAIFETDNYKEPVEIPEAGEVAVPDSVLVYPWTQLRVGVRGESEDGYVVIPTVYADCGTISLGANMTPVGTPPTPSQAEYLQAQIDELRESGIGGGITEETDPTVPAWAKAPEKPRYTAAEVGALPVGTEIPAIDPTLTQSGKAADAKATGDALKNVGGVSTTEKTLLLSLFKNAAYTANMSATIAQLETLWSGGDEPDEPVTPDVTLSSISATYSGGSVPVGTAASSLTGVNVTAHYSDGSTATVTGYTLSGTIVEGSNTITVTYEGMTATFTVTGVADESGGDEPGGDTEVSGDEYVVVTGATATDDGNGNVTVTGLTATDDDNGNITVS